MCTHTLCNVNLKGVLCVTVLVVCSRFYGNVSVNHYFYSAVCVLCEGRSRSLLETDGKSTSKSMHRISVFSVNDLDTTSAAEETAEIISQVATDNINKNNSTAGQHHATATPTDSEQEVPVAPVVVATADVTQVVTEMKESSSITTSSITSSSSKLLNVKDGVASVRDL